MYTIIGGNPFTCYTGTTTFTSLRVVGTCDTFEKMEKLVKENYDDCAGLMLVLHNGKEIKYNENGEFVKPKIRIVKRSSLSHKDT